jgi:hypothetical protein
MLLELWNSSSLYLVVVVVVVVLSLLRRLGLFDFVWVLQLQGWAEIVRYIRTMERIEATLVHLQQ